MNPILKKLSTLLTIITVFTLNTASSLAKVTFTETPFGEEDILHLPRLGEEAETAERSIGIVMERFTQYLFAFAGAVAIYFIIMAGFKLMSARGEEEKVTKAHQMLVWSILGFLLIILSYAIVVNITALVYDSVGR